MAEGQGGEAGCDRDALVGAIVRFLAHEQTTGVREIRASLERVIEQAGPGAVDVLGKRLADTRTEWSYYPGDPLARRIHHVIARHVLRQRPVILGTEHLDAVADKPLLIVANHLSYSDANVVDVLFQHAGGRALSERLTVVAGPKVYTNVQRRFSSLCFGTIKVPQSTARSSDEAVMSTREVALAARQSIQAARERLRIGEALLVFAEGTRSRSAQMQRLLAGVARYFAFPAAWVMPIGIAGTEKLFAIGDDSLTPVPLTLRIGRPVSANRLRERAGRDRGFMMDCVGFAIAALLPREYRGVYGGELPGLESARLLAGELFE